jgi:hypothetical protein
LASASPQRPAAGGRDPSGPGEQGREQVLDLVTGDRDQPGREWVAGPLGQGGDNQDDHV